MYLYLINKSIRKKSIFHSALQFLFKNLLILSITVFESKTRTFLLHNQAKMQELSQIINSGREDAPYKLTLWLQKNHSSIALEKRSKLKNFIREFINMLSSISEIQYSKQIREKISYIGYFFIISLSPPKELIPKITFNKDNEYIFSTKLLLNSWRNPDEDLILFYSQLFHKAVEYFNTGFKTKYFYSRSPIYFYLILPSLIDFHHNAFLPEIQFFLDSIPNIKSEDFNMDFISFTSMVFQKLQEIELPFEKVNFAFEHILHLCNQSSTIFLHHFFFTWEFFFTNRIKQNPLEIQNSLNQIDKVTKFFSVTSSEKHSFPWFLYLNFYQFVQKDIFRERTLNLICNGIRLSNPLEGIPQISKSITVFISDNFRLYLNQLLWPIHYVFTSLGSTINGIIKTLKRIVGASIIPKTTGISFEKIPFSVENEGISSLDNDLYSIYQLKHFENIKDIVPDFEVMIKYCESVRTHLKSSSLFHIVLMKNVIEISRSKIKDNSPMDGQISLLLHYAKETVRTWTKLMIVVAHSQNLMKTYSQQSIVTFTGFSNILVQKFKKAESFLDFSYIVRHFLEIINKFPHQLYPLLAYEITNEMFKSLKKGMITYRFVQFFKSVPLDFESIEKSFLFNILSRMMEIVSSNTELFFAQSQSSSNDLYLWIIFTVRFGAAITNEKPNPMLGLFLRTYEKLIVSTVLANIRLIANQTIAFRTLTFYLKALAYHSASKHENVIHNKRKIHIYEEIQDSAKFEALNAMITLFIEEPKFISFETLVPFLASSFQIGTKEIISQATKILLKKFTIEKAKKYCESQESLKKVFASCFDSMTKVDFDNAKQVLKIIPAYAPLYLQNRRKTFCSIKGISIEDFDFDMDLILDALVNNLSDTPDIISSLFLLLTYFFETILNNLDLPADRYNRPIKKLIFLLCQCSCYDYLHPKIDNYAFYLASTFGDSFIRGDSNAFILSLLDVAGESRSHISKTAMDIAKSFFEYLKNQNYGSTHYFMHQTVELLLSSFPPQTRLFSTLCGFSLLIRFFPNYIKLHHVRSFLVQAVDVPVTDVRFTKLLQRFLNEYLLANPESEKEAFMHMVYDIICPLSISIRYVLLEIAHNLGRPIPVDRIEEIEQCPTEVLMIQRFTLAFLCGLQEPYEISPSISTKIIEFISTRNESCTVEKLSRILALIYSILSNEKVFQAFNKNKNLMIYLHFLCNSLPSKLPFLRNISKKSISLLTKIASNYPEVDHQLREFYMNPERLFHFFDKFHERINFYIRLAKLVPDRIPPTVIKLFFSAVFEYGSKKNSEKMLYLSNFLKILKFFTIQQYIKRDSVKEIILSQCENGFTYLQMYINVITKLLENIEIAYITLTRKYVLRFLVMFPNEVIDYFLMNNLSTFWFVFLENLIKFDSESILLSTFLDRIQHSHDCTSIHPSIYKVIENLSKIKEISLNNDFFKTIDNNFNQLFPIVTNEEIHNDNDFSLLTYTAKSIINTFLYRFNARKITKFCKIFGLNYFVRSDVYRKFMNVVFKKNSEDNIMQLLNLMISNIHIIDPFLLDILLPHSIRYINRSEKLISLWPLLTEWILKKNSLVAPILHSFIYLIDKIPPELCYMAVLLDKMKSTISSSDSKLVIYSLKIAIKLSKNNLLDKINDVTTSFLRQMFAYQHFFEIPFSKYFYEFLSTKPSMIKYLSIEDFSFMKVFINHPHLYSGDLKRLISPYSSVFAHIPQMTNYFPFSLISFISCSLNWLIETNSLNEIEYAFLTSIDFCLNNDITQEDLDFFIHVCFKFLLICFNNGKKSEFFNRFYMLLTKSHTTIFPVEILDSIKIVDEHNFGLICNSAKISNNVFFKNYSELSFNLFSFISSEDIQINIAFFEVFIESLFESEHFPQYQKVINQLIESLLKNFSCKAVDLLNVLVRRLDKSLQNRVLIELWNLYDRLENHSELLKLLINSVEFLSSENQLQIVKKLFDKVDQSKKHVHVFLFSFPKLIESPLISYKTKEFLITQLLIPLLLLDKSSNIEILLRMLINFTDFDTSNYQIQVLMICAHRSNDSESLTFIERIIAYLPNDLHERIHQLFEILPLNLWRDQFLPIIVSLLTPKVQMWQPLFTLAHQFTSIGDELISVTFSKLINEDNKNVFFLFLKKLLEYHSKLKVTQIISGLIKMFSRSKIKIPYEFADKAIKYSGNDHLLEFFIDTDHLPTPRLLMPSDTNDVIFGKYRSLLTTSQAAAIALTFMNEYEAAKESYFQDGPPLFESMKIINNHFIGMQNKNNDIQSILQPLTSINHVNSVLSLLKQATTLFIDNKHIDRTIIDQVTEANLQTLRGKKYLSEFKKEKLAIIQAMITAISGESTLNPDISCFNHIFITLYQRFERLIHHKELKPDVIIEGGNPVCLLMPSMRSQFVRVCGYTTRGMVAIGKEHIETYFNKIDEKISQNEMLAIDWRNFAAFSFNVFCVQPTAALFSITYGAYYRLISHEKLFNFPPFITHEACARIITLCRLSFSSKNDEWLQTIQNSPIVFSSDNGEQWRFWLHHIIELAKEPWFFDLAFGLFCEMSYRSILYSKKEQSKTLEDAFQKLINHPSSQIHMMNIVQNYFDSVFAIDFQEKTVQSKLLTFALECQKLDRNIDDIMEIRQRMATNAFERSLKSLTKSQIELFSNFSEFVSKVKRMEYSDLVSYIQELTQSKHSMIEIRDLCTKNAQIVNDNLPLIFPIRLEKKLEVSLLQINDNWQYLNEDMVQFKMTTNMYNWKNFIAQRTREVGGYHKSVLTLTNAVFLFKSMLQRQYSSRIRKMIMFPLQFFEIGLNIIFIPVLAPAETIEKYFEEATMLTSKEWIQKYTTHDQHHSSENKEEFTMQNYYDETLIVTEEGRESISNLKTNYLYQKLCLSLKESDIMKMRPHAANSIIISCLIKHVCNAPYPTMDHCVFCPQSAIVPMIHSCYDHGTITDIRPRLHSSFRLSPSIVHIIHPSLDGWSVMTVSIFSKVMTKNIESVRSYIETMIGDEDVENQVPYSIEELLHKRTAIENRFLNFCPPRVANVDFETAERWLEDVEHFLNTAKNPEIQPVEAIPWF